MSRPALDPGRGTRRRRVRTPRATPALPLAPAHRTAAHRIAAHRIAAHRIAACLIAACLIAALPAAGQSPRRSLEPAVKAELVERFVRFIDWPQESTWTANRPFVVCVFGASEITEPLRDLLSERSFLRGHPAELVEIDGPRESRSCDVVLLSPGSRRDVEDILAETLDRPILTIGDAEGFAREGVILNFYREQGYVRFELNQDAARRSGLVISSKLQRLARPVTKE